MKFRRKSVRACRRHRVSVGRNLRQLAQDCIVLRHGSARPEDKAYVWASFQTISAILRLPVLRVKALCDLHLADGDLLDAFACRRTPAEFQLGPEHYAFLLDDGTLQLWQPHSVKARCSLFRRQFPDKRISYRRLRCLYKQFRIGFRVIKPGMALTVKQINAQTKQRLICFPQMLQLARDRPNQLFFSDEAIYSSKQAERKVWARKGVIVLQTERNKISFEAVAVCGAEAVDGRMQYAKLVPKALDQHHFADFLTELRQSVQHRQRLYVLVDNLGIHKTRVVKARCEAEDVELIFNGAYSSPFNPIERYWGFAKRLFAQRCLTAVDFKNKARVQGFVRQSLQDVNQESMGKHVRRCLHDMEDWLADYNLNNGTQKIQSQAQSQRREPAAPQ